MKTRKRMISLLFVVLFFLVTFSSCGDENDGSSNIKANQDFGVIPEEQITLTICVEGPPRGTNNNVVREIAEELTNYYNMVHDTKVNFKFDVLTSNQEERTAQIDKLKTEMMAGGGPDIFIFANTYLYGFYEENELLFNNLNKSMHAGIFADLSPYIKEDTNFALSDYHSIIMDAGAAGDKRYVLPLSFSYYTSFIPTNGFQSVEKFVTGTEEYLKEITRIGYNISYISLIDILQMYEKPIDYEHGSLNLSKEELNKAIRLWIDTDKKVEITFDENEEPFLRQYGIKDENSVMFTTLNAGSLATIAIAKADGIMVEEYPMPTMNGGYTASISDAVAVSGNCKNQQEAYEYIKLFLHPDLQSGKALIIDTGEYDAHYGSFYLSAFQGWPVYQKADPESIYLASLGYSYQYPLETGDYSVKAEQMTSAYFKSSIDAKILSGFYRLTGRGDPVTDADIARVVDELYRELQAAASE